MSKAEYDLKATCILSTTYPKTVQYKVCVCVCVAGRPIYDTQFLQVIIVRNQCDYSCFGKSVLIK